jgi:hypothetical protein
LHLDVDATITIDHSDNKENAAATWKKTWGHHSLLVFLDRPEIAGGEALSGLLRPGNAGSNTAADHVTVLEQALKQLPAAYRPNPDDPAGQQILVRSDSAGATHAFATACRDAGVGFSFGYPVDARVRDAVEILNRNDSWYPAIESDGGIRDGAWVAEATGLVEMSGWPARTRLILRKERPHPGAQLRFTDSDGLRITAFITDTPTGVVPGQLGGLELRHRQHARVEDRIRQAKATGLANLPCHRSDANAAWLEIILAATDLVAWTKLIGFTEHRDLATCEIETFRYRVLHVAARITRGARQIRLRIDATWRWATAISQGWNDSEPPSHNRPAAVHPDPRNPPALETPADRATSADLSYPPATINADKAGSTGTLRPDKAPRKIEAKAALVLAPIGQAVVGSPLWPRLSPNTMCAARCVMPRLR